MCDNNPCQFEGSGRKAQEMWLSFCAEWAFGFPCWLKSGGCVGHPNRRFSILVSPQAHSASKESVISVYGVNETLFSYTKIRLIEIADLNCYWYAVLLNKKYELIQHTGRLRRKCILLLLPAAKNDSGSDGCFPLSHPISFHCWEESIFACDLWACFVCQCLSFWSKTSVWRLSHNHLFSLRHHQALW